LPSVYSQVYKHIKSIHKTTSLSQWSNDTFCKKADNELMFNFDQMYSAYSQVFGSRNVNVLVYEDLKYDKACFYKQFASLLHITPDKLESLLETSMKNKTLSRGNNQLVTESPTFNDVFLSYIRSPLKKLLPKQLFKPLRSMYLMSVGRVLSVVTVKKEICIDDLTEDEKKVIQQHFHASNLRLAKKLHLDLDKLKQYGYLD